MKANGKPPRLRQLRLLREILFMTQPRLLAVMLERYPQVVRWTRASRTTCGKGEVPSLAKEGWPRHQVNGPIPLKAPPGWFVQLPIIGGLNQPPRLRPLRRLRGIFLMGAATPPCARRGIALDSNFFTASPSPLLRQASPRRGIPTHSVFLVCCKLSARSGCLNLISQIRNSKFEINYYSLLFPRLSAVPPLLPCGCRLDSGPE